MNAKENTDIFLPYVFHISLILMCTCMMQDYCDACLMTLLIMSAVYLLYWIISNRKSYMPWKIYLHFLIGAATEFFLNYTGVIEKDGGWFSGLGQFLYLCLLGIVCAVFALVNFIMMMIYKHKKI